jgi:methylenetetrahydrofolate dehydrogenase (NADP+)/methenyltetrahydrofolate cyclohydrolase
MAIIFDGKKFAEEKKKLLSYQVKKFLKKGIILTLASIYLSSDAASVLYTKLKKKAAGEIGIDFLDYEFKKADINEIIFLIEKLNNDKSVNGILVQKPVGKEIISKDEWQKIVSYIAKEKDVDGLRENSKFIPATVRAVLEILSNALEIVRLPYKEAPCTVVVVGSRGMVGRLLMRQLSISNYQFPIGTQRKKKIRFEVIGCNSQTSNLQGETLQADIVISATGVPNLISAGMVKPGAIVIDVGSPKGDCDFESVKDKAAFITPVPGGVGPVTVSCLLENLLLAVTGKA